MSKTAVVFSPKYYAHDTGRGHPESAKRLASIITELRRWKPSTNNHWQFVSPQMARLEDIALVHGIDYISFIQKFCKSGGGILDSGDTVASRESFKVALLAVGGAIKAVDLVFREEFKNAFALVRPPGHHAGKFSACGFCIFNNVAIAAKHLLARHGLKRVLILDIDAHHGNGTQEIFYDTEKVLYISLHQDPRGFPGTGFTDEIGEGEGLGYNVNIPLPFGTNDSVYLKAFKEIVMPIANQYKPQFVLVSAGLDGHYMDFIGNLKLSGVCYQKIYEMITSLALAICNGKLVSILEGGYNPKIVGKIAATTTAVMSGEHYQFEDNMQVPSQRVVKKGKKVIEEVKKVHSTFWNL